MGPRSAQTEPLVEHKFRLQQLPQMTTLTAYTSEALAHREVLSVSIHKYLPASWNHHSKVEEVNGPFETDLDQKVLDEHGPGRYRAIVMVPGEQGRESSLTARVFKIGDWNAYDHQGKVSTAVPDAAAPVQDDGQSVSRSLAEGVKQLTSAQTLKTLTQQPSDAGTAKPLIDMMVSLVGAMKDSLTAKGTDPTLTAMVNMMAQQNTALLTALLQRPEEEPAGESAALSSTVETLKAVVDALGDDVKERLGVKDKGTDWAAVVTALAPTLERLADKFADASAARPRVVLPPGTRVEQGRVVPLAEHRRTSAAQPAREEMADMAREQANPAFKDALDAIIGELSKPKEEWAIPELAAFLDSIVVTGDGQTMLDRLVPLTRTTASLAQVSLRLIDPRLGDPKLGPAVGALLSYVREEVEREENPGGTD